MRSDEGIGLAPETTHLLGALSSVLETELSFDHDGQCALLFSGDIELIVSINTGGAAIDLRVPLCAADPTERLHEALVLNYGSLPPSFAIALDKRSGQLLLFTRLPLGSTAGNDFVRVVQQLLGFVPTLRPLLTEVPESETNAGQQSWRHEAGDIRG